MISVCIATFNGEDYILQQIESILKQIGVNDEIIISDDSSSDNTLNLVKSFSDRRIKILEGKLFKSPVFNFENALKFAMGDYIFLSDQDDIWLNDKVEIMLTYLVKGNDLVVSDCKIVDENLKIIDESYYKFNKSGPGFVKNLIKNSYMGCCMAFNKKLLSFCLPFPIYIPMHDSFIGLIAESKFQVKFIECPLILHRKHLSNSSDTATGISKYNLKEKLVFRIKLISAVCSKLLK